MTDSDVYGAMTNTQAAATGNVTAALDARLQALWAGFTGWYDDAQVAALVMQSVALVESATGQTRQQAEAYLRAVYKRLGIEFPAGTDDTLGDYGRRGVAPEDVWERPAEQYRYAKSTGASAGEALEVALARVSTLAAQDVQLAQRDQQTRVLHSTRGLIGYRRVVHPEQSKTGVCGLCLVASDRVYKTDELMPMHSNCKCTVLPMTATHDPGRSLNTDDLERLYKAGGSTAAADLSAIRVTAYTSEELGPVLTRAGIAVDPGSTRVQLGPRAMANRVTGSKARKFSLPRRTKEKLDDFDLRITRTELNIERFKKAGGMEFQLARAEKNLADFKAQKEHFIRVHHREFEEAA